MPRGYRFLITATCGLGLFVALGTGAYFGSLYAPYHKQYEAITGKQAGQNDYQGPSESLPDISGLPGPVERAIANPHPNTGQDHEKRDLAAQEASALWAFWMVVASFLSVLITTVGTIFLYKQIVLTREAVQDTGEATKAMREANQIATEAMENQLRPWLIIDGMNSPRMDIINGTPNVRLKFKIKNIGSSPAISVQYVCWLCAGYKPHIGYDIAWSYYRKDMLAFCGDLFPDQLAEVGAPLSADSNDCTGGVGYVVIAIFYKTIWSDTLRETTQFYQMFHGSEPFIDFEHPLSSRELKLRAWNESPGIIS